MKIQLRKIVTREYSEAYGRLLKLPLKAKDSYWLVKALRLFNAESNDFLDARKACMAKHGIEDGKEYPREKIEALEAELNELLEREIDVAMKQIVLPADTVISANDLILLDDIVRLDETPAT